MNVSDISPVRALQERFMEKTASKKVGVECRMLTPCKSNLAATAVILAISTAIAGAIFLVGVGSIGATAAGAMLGGGVTVALLVYVSIMIRQSRFEKEVEACVREKSEDYLQRVDDFIGESEDEEKYFDGWIEERSNNQSPFYINYVHGGIGNNRIICTVNKKIDDSMEHELERLGYVNLD